MRSRLVISAAVLAALLAASPTAATSPRAPVLIFAASSMKTALDALAAPVAAATGVTITASYGSSAVLARQIEDGAPAEIFISADTDWMDYVSARQLAKPDGRVNLLGNALVLIAPAGQPVALKIAPDFPLASTLGAGRLAVGEPGSVPAGKYAKAALTSLGVWASVQSKLAPAANVRAALMLVALSEAPLGVVYKTDAMADDRVRIVDTFPPSSHPPIVYPMALTSKASADAARVFTYLRGAAAFDVFSRFGFTPPPAS